MLVQWSFHSDCVLAVIVLLPLCDNIEYTGVISGVPNQYDLNSKQPLQITVSALDTVNNGAASYVLPVMVST